MKYFFLILAALTTTGAWSQELPDVRVLQTLRSSGNPSTLPVSVNTRGEISLLGGNSRGVTFQPGLQVGLSLVDLGYGHPVRLDRFDFYPPRAQLGWVEVKRERLEIGAGPAVSSGALTAGLVAYRGALQTLIQHKKTKSDRSLPLTLPASLRDLEAWAIEDTGTFQTYGGITAYVSVSAGLIDVASAAVGVQNQFLVELRRLSSSAVRLTIAEEDLARRVVTGGVTLATASLAAFRGNRLTLQFDLELRNAAHQRLYSEALKGNVKLLQERLGTRAQKLTFEGRDRLFWFGIPLVIGVVSDSGTVELSQNGRETRVDYTGALTRGVLANYRNHQDFSYHSGSSLVLVWSSEMKGTLGEDVDRRFLGRGRLLKVRGFDKTLERKAPFGDVVTQLGIQLAKRELEALDESKLDELAEHLRERCETEWLPCDAEPRFRAHIDELRGALDKSWGEKRSALGKLFLREPAVLYAVLKTLRLRKQVYFKFLSESHLSLEGTAPVEL
jgi:hypothetical protein